MEIVGVLLYPGDTHVVFAQINGDKYFLWNIPSGDDTPSPEEP